MLATHPTSAIDRKHEKIIKYRTGINEALDKYKNEAKVREKAIAKVACDLGTRTLVAQGEVPGGRAFEVGVSVLYWLVSSAGPPAKHNVAEEDQA